MPPGGREAWEWPWSPSWTPVASGASCPQVHLQTQQEASLRMTGMAVRMVRSDGFLALYSGLSASLCRQVCGAEGWRGPLGLAPLRPPDA